MLALLNSPAWLQYIGDRGVKTVEDAANYIQSRIRPSYEQNGFGFYLVVLKEGSMPVGICGLVKRPGLAHVDIGFAFLPQYERQGYGFESAAAIMKHAKEVLKLGIIAAITTKDNVPSINLVKKIGLSFHSMVSLPGDDVELMLFEG